MIFTVYTQDNHDKTEQTNDNFDYLCYIENDQAKIYERRLKKCEGKYSSLACRAFTPITPRPE